MSPWLISFDTTEVGKTVLVGVLIILIGIIAFYYLWLINEDFRIPETDYDTK